MHKLQFFLLCHNFTVPLTYISRCSYYLTSTSKLLETLPWTKTAMTLPV